MGKPKQATDCHSIIIEHRKPAQSLSVEYEKIPNTSKYCLDILVIPCVILRNMINTLTHQICQVSADYSDHVGFENPVIQVSCGVDSALHRGLSAVKRGSLAL